MENAFRQKIATELHRVCNAQARAEFQQLHPFLDAALELKAEFLSAYTSETLNAAPVGSAFSNKEKELILDLCEDLDNGASIDDVLPKARKLQELLSVQP
jgi:hypothetical protein